MADWETKRILVTVKTYPQPSWKNLEVVCTAGIAEDGRFVRLYPISYRWLSYDKQFPKYAWIEVPVSKTTHDPRPESHTPNLEQLKILSMLSTNGKWRERRQVVDPLVSRSVEHLRRLHESAGTSLGIIRPRVVTDVYLKPVSPAEWTEEELARLMRVSLFDSDSPKSVLEKLPIELRYKFRCDDESCTGHDMRCWDWEAAQAYRSFRSRYPADQLESKYMQKFRDEMLSKDLHFYVGTMSDHPSTWTIIGLFYPPLL